VSQYRQIIVHAGLSKTGTTSIQENCERYSSFLRERSIVYPQFSFDDQPFITHSIPVTVAITGRQGKYGLMLEQRFTARVDEVMRSCRQQLDHLLETPQGDTLILSTELIEGFDARDMATLRSYLAPHTQRLRVVAYIRSPQSGLESLFQERIKMGGLPDSWQLVGRVRQKYENLRQNFSDELELVNFHDAARGNHGLVGYFLAMAGLPDEDIAGLEFVSRNERLSMEAFRLIWAINERYPPRDQELHQVARKPRDLDALGQLPGPQFQLTEFMDSDLHQACLDEAAWLESRLGFQFPHELRKAPEPLWQDDTLAVLEKTIRALHKPPIERFCAEFLWAEAQKITAAQPLSAGQLEAVARRLLAEDHF
jgi:hypothetical protein